MTIPRLNEISAYWRKHPPLHIVVPHALGVKPQEDDKPLDKEENAAELLAALGFPLHELNSRSTDGPGT